MKYLTALVLFLFTASSLFAQNTVRISGVVSNKSGKGIDHAIIALVNSTVGTYSDERGHYSLSVPKGEHVLVVSLLGFTPVRKAISVTTDTVFNFILEEKTVALDEVLVVGQSHSERMKQNVFSASNVDIQSVTSSLNCLNTIVQRTSGIRLREEGGVGSDFNLSISGLSGNAVRYFIDGIPLSSLGNGVSLSNLPVNLVERIEVFKGVVPTDLGEDALGGAINIVTRRDGRNYADISVGAGSFSTYKVDFNGQYVHGKTGLTIRPSLGMNYSKNNYIMRDVEVWNPDEREFQKVDRRRFHDGYRSFVARLEAGFQKRSWADEAFVGVTVSHAKKELQTGQKQSIVIGDAMRTNESFNVYGRYSKRDFLFKHLSAKVLLSLTTNHTLLSDTAFRLYDWNGEWVPTSYSEVTGRGKSIRHYQRPQCIVHANFKYTIDDRQSVSLNYMFNGVGNKRYDDFDDQFIPTDDYIGKHIIGLTYNRQMWDNRAKLSAFVKDYIFRAELKQQDMFWITGINDIAHSAVRNNMGYGAGGRFSILPSLSVKASYEHSVRLPVSSEFLGNGQTVYPNFKLRPEMSHNINLGFFGEVTPRTDHKISYETNAFVRKVKDYIIRLPISDRQSQYSNVAAATVKGIEGEVSYEYRDVFRALANATYLNERNKNKYLPSGNVDITYNNRMPNRPWLYANLELSSMIKNPFGLTGSRLKLDYAFRYIQWFYLTWEAYGSKSSKETIPSQFAQDAVATYSFKNDKYSLSLECTNLFDRKLYDNYMLQKPGRSFFAKFRIFIN